MFLTIGIPVYNGEKYIEETITKILQANFDWNFVEILVSDNNSNDSTCNIVEKYNTIKLYKHTENIGYDRNIDRIFRYANGRYVWTIGADDILTTNKVDEINKIVATNITYSVIFAGESFPGKNGIMYNAVDFLFASNFRSGFVSNNIINKDYWLESNASDFFDSGWVHYGMILKILQKAPSYILEKMYVTEIEETRHNKIWIKGGQGLLIGLKLVEIFHQMDKWGYSEIFKNRSKLVIKGAYPKFIIYSKCLGLKVNNEILKQFIKLYGGFLSFWLIDLPFLILPSFLYTFFFSIYKSFKHNA